MTDRAQSTGRIKGHDAMHRARILTTHPTHACSEQFCWFDGMRIASLNGHDRKGRVIPPFPEMADRIATGADR